MTGAVHQHSINIVYTFVTEMKMGKQVIEITLKLEIELDLTPLDLFFYEH